MKNEQELEALIRSRLEEIKPFPPRNPQSARRARAQFLNQAVSASEFQRHKGWRFIFRKEQFAMNMIISILVIAGLLFGGGATVNAAQDDLPNEPLYALKMWSEDVSLQLRSDPEAKIDRLMELAQTRIQEMSQLMENGQTPPDQVQLRLEQHIHQALQICSTLDDAALDRSLLQLRDQLRERDRDMERLQIHAAQDAQPILERTRTMLRERLQLVEDGLLNHEMFRNTVRNGFRFGQDEDFTPPAQNGNGQQNGQTTPQPGGNDNGNGQQNGQTTPQPGGSDNGNGPGPNPDPGGPNPTPGEPNTDPGGNNNDSGSGSGSGGNENDTGGNGNGSGGSDSGGSGSGSGGSGSGGNKP
jgi:uncharacterized membrane protein YgcG